MASYDVDEQRIPASGMKMRCPKCGTSVVLHPPEGTSAAKPPFNPSPQNVTRQGAPPVLTRPEPPRLRAPAVNAPLPKPVLRSDPKAAPHYTSRLGAVAPAVSTQASRASAQTPVGLDLPAIKTPVPASSVSNKVMPPELSRVSAPRTPSPPPLDPFAEFHGSSDLPAVKATPQPLPPESLEDSLELLDPFEVDLPAPSHSDLPALQVMPDLPAAKFTVDVPVAKQGASLPRPKAGLGPSSGHRSSGAPSMDFSELDLGMSEPPPAFGEQGGSSSRKLTPQSDYNPFEEITSTAGAALQNALRVSASPDTGAGIHGSADEAAYAELFGSVDQTADSKAGQTIESLEFDSKDFLQDDEPEQASSAAFGQVDLGMGESAESMEFSDIPEEPNDALAGFSPAAPEAVRAGSQPATPVEAPKSKFKFNALIISAGVLLLLFGAGAALGFTEHGYFGIYTIEQYLPAAGKPAEARRVIQQAEELVANDTFADRTEALRVLAGGRKKMGLNRALLSRSLVHEALYQLRFAGTEGSTSHLSMISSRLEDREWNVPGKDLALAAKEAAAGGYDKAETYLHQARAQSAQDFVAALLGAELALKKDKLKDAERDFQTALRLGARAAAQWGLVRVYAQSNQPAKAQTAIQALLKLSPQHSGARLMHAQLLWKEGSQEALKEGLVFASQVAGATPVNGKALLAPKQERATAFSLIGLIYEQEGRLKEANQAYADALKIDAIRAEALLGAGRMLLRDKRPADALARFESVINGSANAPAPAAVSLIAAEDRPVLVQAKLGAAKALLDMGRVQMARDMLQPLIKEYPKDAEIKLWLGKCEQELGNFDVAEKHLQEAIELAPKNFAGYIMLSQLYVATARPSEAAQVLRKAEGYVPDNAERRRMMGQSELARGNTDAALQYFHCALELEPNNLDIQFDLGVGLRHAGKLDEAKAQFDEVEKRDPTYPELALERGRIFEARGEWEVAVRNYRMALEKAPQDSGLMLRLGACQVEAGHIDAAEATLTNVAKLRPNSADVSYFLGRVDFARKRYNEALTNFQRSTALDARQSEYQTYAGWAALELGSLGQALEFVNEALELDPSMGEAYWVRGRIRLRAGAVKDARDDFERALKLKPSRYEIYAHLGDAYDQLRQVRSAIDAYHKALSYDKERGEWWARLGALFMDVGQPREAQQALSQATALGDPQKPVPPWLPEAHRVYAEALSLQGRQDEALVHYQKYLDIAPSTALDRQDVEAIVKAYGHKTD